MSDRPRILYCHCAYAHVVPKATKEAVLRGLTDAGVDFDAAPDLCEMAARRDPSLEKLVEREGEDSPCKIVACYPRAVKWLLHGAGVELPDDVEVLNMRTETPETILNDLLKDAETRGLQSTGVSDATTPDP